MFSQHADIRFGGCSVDGVSRAGLNKIISTHFAEGMRKPSRNGNPGELDSAAAHILARHFLKVQLVVVLEASLPLHGKPHKS